MKRAREKEMLQRHGTTLAQLKPSSIWRAAQADLQRRVHNSSDNGLPDTFMHYAFHRKHVIGATTPNEIIQRAVADVERSYGPEAVPSIGMASGKSQTRLLYSNLELLRKALA
jgi:hypothetical protein